MSRIITFGFVLSFVFIISAFAQDFDVPINVSDGLNQKDITVGVDPSGTDGYESGLDFFAPPKPPSGFDARSVWDGEAYITDIRDNSLTWHTFIMEYQRASGQDTTTLTWDSASLISLGEFLITDRYGSSGDTVDMKETNTFTAPKNTMYEEQLKILVLPYEPASIGDDFGVNYNPDEYLLVETYPNPFNPAANIRYTLHKAAQVRVEIFNSGGKFIETLVDSYQTAGEHKTGFNGTGYSSGAYFVRVTADARQVHKKMILVK